MFSSSKHGLRLAIVGLTFHKSFDAILIETIFRDESEFCIVMAVLEDWFLWGWQDLEFSQEPIHSLKLLFDDSQRQRYSPSLKAKIILQGKGKRAEDVTP